jgi:hypothetical protein
VRHILCKSVHELVVMSDRTPECLALAAFNGNPALPAPVRFASGSATLSFTSDIGIVAPGFTANYVVSALSLSCSLALSTPIVLCSISPLIAASCAFRHVRGRVWSGYVRPSGRLRVQLRLDRSELQHMYVRLVLERVHDAASERC